MKREKVTLPAMTRAAEVMPATADAEARTVDVVWSTGAPVRRGGFFEDDFIEELSMEPKAIRLDRLNAGGPFLDAHDRFETDAVIGSVAPGSVKIEKGQGFATIRFAASDRANKVWALVKDGHLRGVSVGYSVHRYQISEGAGEGGLDLYRAIDWEPFEVSAVPVPADAAAGFRGQETGSTVILERSDTMKTKTDAAGAAEVSAAPAEAPVEETRAIKTAPPSKPDHDPEAAIRAERDRVEAIMALGERHKLDNGFVRGLIKDASSVAEARAKVLDHLAERADAVETRSEHPVRVIRDEFETMRGAVANALLHRSSPGKNELTDAGREYRGMRLHEIARAVIERRGTRQVGRTPAEIAERALHSTSDFPYILADVANKTLRMGYEETVRTFQPFCRRVTAADFKTINRVQLGAAPSLVAIAESGEVTYGTIGEGREQYAIASYGKAIGINRKTIVNDDLDAFTRIPQLFGAAAARLENGIVYGVLTANAAMGDGTALFHANHSNLATGGGSALSATSLSTARTAMRKQTGLGGETINVMPRYLVMPAALETTAEQLIATIVPAQTSNVVVPFIRSLIPIAEPLLDATSATAWYLAAEPSQIDTIEYAYLEGQEGVRIESEVGFDIEGVKIKAMHDFGAKAIDHRGLYKANGA